MKPASFIICVSAGTNHRAITYSSIFFIGHTTSAGGCSDVTLLVAGYGAYSAELFIFHQLFELLVCMVEGISIGIPDRFPWSYRNCEKKYSSGSSLIPCFIA
jgi:hypothetical protein